jgi:plastocyanin
MLRFAPLVTIVLTVIAWAALAQPSGRRHLVTIQNLQFLPATLQIRAGDSVMWTNRDDRDHLIQGENGAFQSGNLRTGESFTRRFDEPGTFAYGCAYHPRMRGRVVVER